MLSSSIKALVLIATLFRGAGPGLTGNKALFMMVVNCRCVGELRPFGASVNAIKIQVHIQQSIKKYINY